MSQCSIEDTGLDNFYLRTPFDDNLRLKIRSIPSDSRVWDEELKVWIIDWNYYDFIQDAVREIFGERATVQ